MNKSPIDYWDEAAATYVSLNIDARRSYRRGLSSSAKISMISALKRRETRVASELADEIARDVYGVPETPADAPPRPAVEHVKMDVPGYANLADVLIKAYEQSAKGKGKERHANDKPFDRQPIMEIGRMVGPGYQLGQAQKKAQEAFGMFSRGQHDRAMAEILGIIVYAAAAYLTIEEAATGQASSPAPDAGQSGT